MSFTPGPYLFEKQHRGKYLVLAERPNKCPIEVAECFSEPNARLFAASPEMVDKLEHAAVALNNATPHIADKQCREDMLWLSGKIWTFLSRFELERDVRTE